MQRKIKVPRRARVGHIGKLVGADTKLLCQKSAGRLVPVRSTKKSLFSKDIFSISGLARKSLTFCVKALGTHPFFLNIFRLPHNSLQSAGHEATHGIRRSSTRSQFPGGNCRTPGNLLRSCMISMAMVEARPPASFRSRQTRLGSLSHVGFMVKYVRGRKRRFPASCQPGTSGSVCCTGAHTECLGIGILAGPPGCCR